MRKCSKSYFLSLFVALRIVSRTCKLSFYCVAETSRTTSFSPALPSLLHCTRLLQAVCRMPRDVPSGSFNDIDSPVSLADVKELWDAWEIHCLILVSLFLQVFLFLMAPMRRRTTSLFLRTSLWLAYLSADAVAIFVLGHLAVHASKPRHQLMYFWAPFVLIHLGGQDTITAFSRQDNELWRRHLLSLLTQVGVAGYVVGKASWPDSRLKAAMVLLFISGCFKYAERTYCLYYSSPAVIKLCAQEDLPKELGVLSRFIKKDIGGTSKEFRRSLTGNSSIPAEMGKKSHVPNGASKESEAQRYRRRKGRDIPSRDTATAFMKEVLDHLSKCDIWDFHLRPSDIISLDAPPNGMERIIAADELSGLLQKFLSNAGRYRAYDYVGLKMANCYIRLYTKGVLRKLLSIFYTETIPASVKDVSVLGAAFIFLISSPLLLYPLFQYFSTPVALVLFMVAEKGDQHDTSQVDIKVSYILLVGAVLLDVFSAILFLFSELNLELPRCLFHVANYILPACSKRQWSEELAQYSMIKRHTVQLQYVTGMASIKQWIGRRLGRWGVGLLDLTGIPITKPIKEFILDSLVLHGIRQEWHVASSRGLLAVQNWMNGHQDPVFTRTREALEKIISNGADFPTSVLIWHIATDICYYFEDHAISNYKRMKKYKEVSRELSNYIMYLVFKCGMKLTTNSQLLHDKAHDEIEDILYHPQHFWQDEKEAVMTIFEAEKTESFFKPRRQKEQNRSIVEIEKQKELVNEGNNLGKNHVQKLLQGAQEYDSPVLPRACKMAQGLININDQADRWGLIAAVWSEMLYYIAPRCGCAFHYEHLSTGGEFATHVLLLMRVLGPFLPTPDA
ncbi:hypothetical protein ACP70R_004079 [Stipagrostis hirtigluma subsp. patula]